jgi:Flp pilus assembly protein TadD
MRVCARTVGVSIVAALIITSSLAAQNSAADSGAHAADSVSIPARPKPDAGTDTNSALANYEYGMKMVSQNPAEAVRAFYWASKIDPASGDAMYALRTAKLIAMSDGDLARYFGFGQEKRTPAQLALDSLIYRAYTVNPFLFSSIDGALMRRTIEAETATMFPQITPALLAQTVAQRMRQASSQPWMAYTQGRFQDALDAYATELHTLDKAVDSVQKKKPSAREKAYAEMRKVRRAIAAVEIHSQRARIFYQIHQFDSASTEMTTALSLLQAQDSGHTVLLYQSKAIFEQSLGMIYEHDKRFDLAREAYGQALAEDLSYYAAHSHLALLQLKAGDTTAAVTEMDLAVQLQPDDAALRYSYAVLLIQARRDAEAAQQLIKSIAVDPYYAPPRLLLARISDYEEYTEEAVKNYQEYVALTTRNDSELPRVKMRLAKLTASLASTQPH